MAVKTFVKGHEFWMPPSKFLFASGEKLLVRFMVGENFMGDQWDLKTHRIEKLEHHKLSGIKSLIDSVTDIEKQNLAVTLKEEGTHMIVLQSNNAFIELDGEKFNEYLKEDGLDDVYAHREKTNTLSKPSKEFYSRYSKLLVQVGQKKDDTYKKVIGFPIEIIPEQNPYSLKKGDPVRFKILFEGKPLFGARVKVWNRFDNRTTLQNIHTEKNGVIETRISNPGPWMVSVVKMVPSKLPGAEWQSYWGSLVFGVE
jgi:uncharacterized GH25 family protein